MKISPSLEADVARWWIPREGFRIQEVEGIGGGKAVVELSKSDNYRLNFMDVDREFFEYGEEDGLWIVSPMTGFNYLAWWESPSDVIEWFDPFQRPEMYRQFEMMGTSSKEYLKFASKFGFLGKETWSVWLAEDVMGYGESLLYWRLNHQVFCAVKQLWNCVKNRDAKTIQNLIEFDTDRTFFSGEVQTSLERVLLDVPLAEAPFGRLLRDEDESEFWLRAGRELLLFIVSAMLQQHCQPWLKISSAPQLRLVPTTLLGSIYIFLTEEILGKSLGSYRCKGCGVLFPAYHGKRQYCSDACKARAYRKRKEEAGNG